MIIDRYISLEIIRPLATGLGLLILIFTGYSAARFLSLAAEGQLEMVAAFKLVGLNTLVALEILLPSALFFSALYAVGRLYRDAEMYALLAAGVGRARILESVLKFSLVVALVTGFISIKGRPWAYQESYALEARAAADVNLKKMAAGDFVELQGSDYVFFARSLDFERGMHGDVFLFKRHADYDRSEILVARRASLPVLHPDQMMQATFLEGYNYLLDDRRGRDLTVEFGELVVRRPNSTAQERYRRKAESTTVLANSDNPKDIAEYQWRISTPLATLLLGLMAVPLGYSAPRESRIRGVLFALVVYVALFSTTSVLRTLIEQGKLGSVPGLWTAYFLEALLLVVLMNGHRLSRR